MDITCTNCKTTLTIADHKLPQGKKASLVCPKCKERIHIPSQPAAAPRATSPIKTTDISKKNASETPLDFLDENVRVAMLCMGNTSSRNTMEGHLKAMGYRTVAPMGVDKAREAMKFQRFDLIAIDDTFDNKRSAKMLRILTTLEMLERRRLFAILVTSRARSRDNMAAFHQSVNLIINPEHIEHARKIFSQALQEHEQFYSVFFESMKEVGKI